MRAKIYNMFLMKFVTIRKRNYKKNKQSSQFTVFILWRAFDLDATKHAHFYLLLDLRQDIPGDWRLPSNLFPYDKYHYVYVPKKFIKGSELGHNYQSYVCNGFE